MIFLKVCFIFQLEIKDVHIRYEDNITFNRCFSMGIKIDSLSIQSCNEQWSPGYRCRDPGDEYSFQLLQLCGFSVYMDEIPETQFWDVENLDLVSSQCRINPMGTLGRVPRGARVLEIGRGAEFCYQITNKIEKKILYLIQRYSKTE